MINSVREAEHINMISANGDLTRSLRLRYKAILVVDDSLCPGIWRESKKVGCDWPDYKAFLTACTHRSEFKE